MSKHPMQPVEFDARGVIRFKENKIVSYLLDLSTNGNKGGMNQIAVMPFSQEDREQFAQLIGYSVSGYGDLSYVSEDTIAKADLEAEKLRAGK